MAKAQRKIGERDKNGCKKKTLASILKDSSLSIANWLPPPLLLPPCLQI